MRIAIIVPEFPPNTIGGGGVVYGALSRRLQARHEVRVFTADDRTRSWQHSRTATCFEYELEVLKYPLLPIFRNVSALATVLPPNPRAALNLRQDLRIWAPDVAHLHGIGYAFVDLAAHFLRRLDVPYVLTDHGLPASYTDHTLAIRMGYHAYHKLILNRTVTSAARVTAVSTQESELCSRTFGTNVLTIPNGITPLLAEQISASTENVEFPVQPYLAAAGRIVHNKGFDVLLEALNSNPSLPSCYLAGDWNASDYGRALHARGGTRLIFLGPLSRSKLNDLFAHASAVVVPSRSEPFGLVGFEALSANARVVATQTGGLFDFANKMAPVSLVAPGSYQELAEAIAQVLTLGPISKSETTARDQMMDLLNWDDITLRYEEILLSLGRV